MNRCDVCGQPAAYLVQFRENPRSTYGYCYGHSRPYLDARYQHEIYRIRYPKVTT